MFDFAYNVDLLVFAACMVGLICLVVAIAIAAHRDADSTLEEIGRSFERIEPAIGAETRSPQRRGERKETNEPPRHEGTKKTRNLTGVPSRPLRLCGDRSDAGIESCAPGAEIPRERV